MFNGLLPLPLPALFLYLLGKRLLTPLFYLALGLVVTKAKRAGRPLVVVMARHIFLFALIFSSLRHMAFLGDGMPFVEYRAALVRPLAVFLRLAVMLWPRFFVVRILLTIIRFS